VIKPAAGYQGPLAYSSPEAVQTTGTVAGAADGDDTWYDFALVARDLVGQRPLAEIPLAARIAAATVEAFEQR
jgi:hypothetical protein